jgi:multiple sugar transport system substrate-binding protein
MDDKLSRREFLKAAGLTLAGLSSASALAACAPSATAPAATSAPPAATTAATYAATVAAQVPKVAPINILINDSPWYSGFEKLVALYQQTSGNQVKLAVTPFTGMLEQTRNAVTAKESNFDIVNLNEAWYATFYAGGFVAPIKSIDPNFQLDSNIIEYVYSTRWNAQKKYSTSDGELLGLPINGNIQLFYYREDLFQQAGLKPPETWDDVVAAAKKLHNPPNVYGFAQRGQRAGWSCGFDWFAFLRSFKSDWVASPPNDWTVTVNNAGAKASMAQCLDLLKSYGPPDLASAGQPQLIQLMASGKLAMANMVVASFPGLDDPKSSTVVNKVNVTVMPKAADGVHAPSSGIWVMSIPKNLPDARKQAALTFLQWALSKDAQIQYTKFGAVPVRQDVYTSDLATQQPYRWMKAMADSTPYIRENVRIPEGTQVTDSIELHVNQAIAGQLTGDQAVDAMAQDIFGILQKAGYPTKLS